jgi:NAD/NADP transhydrogenase beta subunit
MSARLSTPPSLPRVPEHSWILRSKGRARLFAGLAGVVVAVGTSVAEWFFYQAGEPPLIMMIATDVFAGVLAALLIAGVLGNMVDRTDAVRRQLETIAEMNHHVRNALQLISFSAYYTHDQETISTIRQGAERIEWALREILGSGAMERPPQETPPADKKPPGQISA